MKALWVYKGEPIPVVIEARWQRKSVQGYKVIVPPRVADRLFRGLETKIAPRGEIYAGPKALPLTDKEFNALPLDGGGQ